MCAIGRSNNVSVGRTRRNSAAGTAGGARTSDMRQRPGDCCVNGTGLPPRPMTATTVTRGHPIKLCCECRVYQSNEWDAVLLPSEEHQALRFWRTEVLVCRRHVLNEIRRQVLHPPATCLHDRSRLSKASDPNLVWCIESLRQHKRSEGCWTNMPDG